MKADIHPKYETVVFRDLASGVAFLTRSTVSLSGKTATATQFSTLKSLQHHTRSTPVSSASWTPLVVSSASTPATKALVHKG
jgi:ribosomal protein L31